MNGFKSNLSSILLNSFSSSCHVFCVHSFLSQWFVCTVIAHDPCTPHLCLCLSVLSSEETKCDSLQAELKTLKSKEIHLLQLNNDLELQRNLLQSILKQSLPWLNSSSVSNVELPLIFVITPTYARPEQKAELTRLSQTLLLVPRVHWIVIEDSDSRTPLVSNLLQRFPHPHTQLTALTPPEHKLTEDDPNWRKPRGVYQRNAALRWLREQPDAQGVLYFADDDNTYDVTLFAEVSLPPCTAFLVISCCVITYRTCTST